MGMLRVSLTNDVREVTRVHAALADFLGEEGVPPSTIHHARLVVEELLVNVVRYGYDDRLAHRINLDVRTEPRRVVITIEDDGHPFNPNDAPPPVLDRHAEERRVGGLGIFLVKKLSRELTYVRANNRNRVRATIDFAAK
ncbi:MAG TPA: ATP-binding protein [Candidatus Krumholzibacteria bacterium]|nr:ATP-binding protein [Candidatus Krumholzibacteria bacterium]